VTLDGHLKLTDFGLAGAIVKYKNSRHNITADVSQVQLDPDLVIAMSNTKPDEPTATTDDIVSESSEASTHHEAETMDPDHEIRNENKLKWVRRRTVCGTAGYRAPEQVQERYLDYFSRSGYDERADWFSLGVCCFTMMTGRRPFPTKQELLQSDSQRDVAAALIPDCLPSNSQFNAEVAKRVMNDLEYRCLMFEVIFPSYFDDEPDAKAFIETLLSRNPDNRPRYDGIRSHPWMLGENFQAEEIMKKTIPSWVKQHAYLQSVRNDEIYGSNPQSLNHSERSLTGCIESLCSDCFEKHGAAYAESFALKWSTMARARTLGLFRHWNYMSDDVIALEAHATTGKTNGKLKKQSLSERLNEIFRSNSSSSRK